MGNALPVQLGTQPSAYAKRALALVVAFAVLMSTLVAGQRYFYCPPMNLLERSPCCARHAPDDADDTTRELTAVDRPPGRCCAPGVFDDGDDGVAPGRVDVPPAAATVLPAPVDLPPARRIASSTRLTHVTRAGPPRAGPGSWRIRIDVSLT